MKPELQAALASGAVAVTPNRRLARQLHREFAAAALAHGRRAWNTPIILPYAAWLETLWLEMLAAEGIRNPPRLLTRGQASYAWQRIVASDAARRGSLVDARSAAVLAAEAWELLHDWGAGGESWRGWPAFGLSDDQSAFIGWSEAYAAMLKSVGALDQAQLADVVALHASALPGLRTRAVLLLGFTEHSPQQQRLTGALAAAGTRIERADPVGRALGIPQRAVGTTSRDELARALAWGRAVIAARSDAVAGIAVADLSARRAEVRELAEEILCPALQWPGRELETRPYNISLGDRLSEGPLVGTALELLALGHSALPLERVAAVVRSPYLGGSQSLWTRRATLEARWIDEGRQEITLGEAIASLRGVDPTLAERWLHASRRTRLPASASPRQWAEAWRDWLVAIGWPGDRTLSSAEYQARGAWEDLLIEFGALAAVETRMTRGDALGLLRSLASEKVFQPESGEAPVQILGLLEAQGLSFDALWVAGLSAERWPPAPEPNPLLPIFWQRERGLPRSSAARELAYARMQTERFQCAAPRVVFSHAEGSEETMRAPSALIAGLPVVASDDVPPTAARLIYEAATELEAVPDDIAPPLVPGQRAPGGAGLFEKQSDCPFRAVAIHRLDTDVWPKAVEGLSPLERGDLLHRVFAALWRDLGDEATLASLSSTALADRVDAAVTLAMESNAVNALRWRALPPLVAQLERQRLSQLAIDWLDEHERTRAPFRLAAAELKLGLAFEQFRIDLRVDRVDALHDGGVAIIDYKTGRVVPPSQWFDVRLQAPQLALYALAWRRSRPYDPVRAVAYAQVRRGELKLEGLAADDGAWPELTRPRELRNVDLPDWRAVEERWLESLSALAEEIGRGYAAVAPRDLNKTCSRCGLHALCRIGTPVHDGRETEDDDD